MKGLLFTGPTLSSFITNTYVPQKNPVCTAQYTLPLHPANVFRGKTVSSPSPMGESSTKDVPLFMGEWGRRNGTLHFLQLAGAKIGSKGGGGSHSQK